MFVGQEDELADVNDNRWTFDAISANQSWPVVLYSEIHAGHESFMVGLDMSYFESVVDLVHKYSK